ncbi:hypothetical protein DENSPDRAFT_865147 [Dentipellis sp. KUC8613]|nr:hypothetical protein DENSPDRAFT_865147 [Dentipellis sp. KUC8613]
MDDDDDFLYGGSAEPETVPAPAPALAPQAQPVAKIETVELVPEIPFGKHETSSEPITPLTPLAVKEEQSAGNGTPMDVKEEVQENGTADAEAEGEGEAEDEDENGDESDEEDDIEFIMEPPTRSLDLRLAIPVRRSHRRNVRIALSSSRKASLTLHPAAPPPSLTTEYTPRERGGVTKPSETPQPSLPTPSAPSSSQPPHTSPSAEPSQSSDQQAQPKVDDGPDPNTLPPVTAPPGHPSINLDAPGTLDGRSILEVDLANMADKMWRRPGADISDWFNYGFDEISWEAYCYRRREVGDLANVLKANVLNFAGMPEDQLTQLPPEIRTMVLTGATAMMSNGGGGQMMPGMNVNGMMGPGDMGMQPMMGPMMVGMGGDMGMDGAGPQGVGVGVGVGVQQNAPPDQNMGQNMGEGFGPQPGMGMGMPSDYGMQDPNAMQQQMYPAMEGPVAPTPVPVGAPNRGAGTPNSYRGRGMGPGMGPGMGMRGGRGGFVGRGRGHPIAPVRPASPLPPNVPTGPRNQNKYKDRDNNAPAVDGLDYGGGGGGQDRGSSTPLADFDDRGGRKRRDRSPGDDRRESKRR